MIDLKFELKLVIAIMLAIVLLSIVSWVGGLFGLSFPHDGEKSKGDGLVEDFSRFKKKSFPKSTSANLNSADDSSMNGVGNARKIQRNDGLLISVEANLPNDNPIKFTKGQTIYSLYAGKTKGDLIKLFDLKRTGSGWFKGNVVLTDGKYKNFKHIVIKNYDLELKHSIPVLEGCF